MTEVDTVLFRADPNGYAADYQHHLFEQYKLYVESADRISSRRDKANNFFLAVNTALLTIVGVSGSIAPLRQSADGRSLLDSETAMPVILVALAGLLVCATWYRLVRSYRDLNSAKFRVIHEIEAHLPLAVYDAEWEVVGRGERPKLYQPFTHLEARVPAIFAVVYLLALLYAAVWPLV